MIGQLLTSKTAQDGKLLLMHGLHVASDMSEVHTSGAMGEITEIQKRREELGWGQQLLAKRAHVSRGTVAKIERNLYVRPMKLKSVTRALEAAEAERDRVRHTSDGTSPPHGATSHARSAQNTSEPATYEEIAHEIEAVIGRLLRLSRSLSGDLGKRPQAPEPEVPFHGSNREKRPRRRAK